MSFTTRQLGANRVCNMPGAPVTCQIKNYTLTPFDGVIKGTKDNEESELLKCTDDGVLKVDNTPLTKLEKVIQAVNTETDLGTGDNKDKILIVGGVKDTTDDDGNLNFKYDKLNLNSNGDLMVTLEDATQNSTNDSVGDKYLVIGGRTDTNENDNSAATFKELKVNDDGVLQTQEQGYKSTTQPVNLEVSPKSVNIRGLKMINEDDNNNTESVANSFYGTVRKNHGFQLHYKEFDVKESSEYITITITNRSTCNSPKILIKSIYYENPSKYSVVGLHSGIEVSKNNISSIVTILDTGTIKELYDEYGESVDVPEGEAHLYWTEIDGPITQSGSDNWNGLFHWQSLDGSKSIVKDQRKNHSDSRFPNSETKIVLKNKGYSKLRLTILPSDFDLLKANTILDDAILKFAHLYIDKDDDDNDIIKIRGVDSDTEADDTTHGGTLWACPWGNPSNSGVNDNSEIKLIHEGTFGSNFDLNIPKLFDVKDLKVKDLDGTPRILLKHDMIVSSHLMQMREDWWEEIDYHSNGEETTQTDRFGNNYNHNWPKDIPFISILKEVDGEDDLNNYLKKLGTNDELEIDGETPVFRTDSFRRRGYNLAPLQFNPIEYIGWDRAIRIKKKSISIENVTYPLATTIWMCPNNLREYIPVENSVITDKHYEESGADKILSDVKDDNGNDVILKQVCVPSYTRLGANKFSNTKVVDTNKLEVDTNLAESTVSNLKNNYIYFSHVIPDKEQNKLLVASLLYVNRIPIDTNPLTYVADATDGSDWDNAKTADYGANNELADKDKVGPTEDLDNDNTITFDPPDGVTLQDLNVNDFNFPDEYHNSFRLTYHVQVTM